MLLGDAEERRHFFMQETLTWFVGLNPFAVEDELGDGALAGVLDDLIGGAGGALDVDFGEGDGVAGEKTLGLATVAAPVGRVDQEFHRSIVSDCRRK